ncbi:MAG: tyrosine transporter [Parachlamydiaceae bacterium]|nr:tyrosine transporter [Parachlamydiaceae bacterium]
MARDGTVLKGVLLIAGTSIGGGMLALPVLTCLAGFLPAFVVYLLCWLFMASTGLILLEICCWMKADSNLVTMAEELLGWPGKACAWLLYLFLFYCLTVAYIVGCGSLVVEAFEGSIPGWLGALIFVILASPLIFVGARLVGRINVVLMFGLALSYLAFVVLGFKHINSEQLLEHNWSFVILALPIAFTAFAYHGIIPTLVTYMHRDIPRIRKAIMIGSFLPLIVYTIWQALILGIVPTCGPGGLEEALHLGHNAVYPLKYVLNSPTVYVLGQFFAFFALVTSFLGVSLGLADFLADGLSIKKSIGGKVLLCVLVLLPPFFIAVTYPGIFLIALDYAGGFGCALLLGLLPILMVWSGRYNMGLKGEYTFPGGKVVLLGLVAFVCLELFSQFSIIIRKLLV